MEFIEEDSAELTIVVVAGRLELPNVRPLQRPIDGTLPVR